MTETSKATCATCATCQWWGPAAQARQLTFPGNYCHHRDAPTNDATEPDWWCSEHPDRKLPDVHGIAGGIAVAIVANDRLRGIAGEATSERDSLADSVARFAYDYADAMLAEAKRRRGSGA